MQRPNFSEERCTEIELSILMTFKRNNLDKIDGSIVFGTLYSPLSQSSALNCAKRAEGTWVQLMWLFSLWFVTLCITWNSSGRHKHKPDTCAHTRSDLPKSWGEELIKPYLENNQDFNTATCEKQWASSLHLHQVEKLRVSGAWGNRGIGISGQQKYFNCYVQKLSCKEGFSDSTPSNSEMGWMARPEEEQDGHLWPSEEGELLKI